MAMFHQHGRFYEQEYPEVEDIVIVQVLKIDDKIGAYVSLLEYDGKEGMINLGEISKRRIRSMSKLLRVGSTEVCMVVSVDEDKGYINLSKKRVASEDIPPKQDVFHKAKAVHGIMQHVAQTNEINIEELCSKVSWPLHIKYPSAYDAFKKHIDEEISLWDEIDWTQPGEDLTAKAEKIKADIETNLQRRLMQSMVRLQAKVDVSCSDYEGIEAVRAALMEGFKASTPECEVSIKLIAHPVFALSCMCRDKVLGIATLDEAMEHIRKAIESRGGEFAIRSKPAAATTETKDEEGSGSEGSGSDSESEQDETMGNIDEKAMAELMEKTKDLKEDED
jgi:translation initiation factor 2 subunit 1